jgi:hypothetical protein
MKPARSGGEAISCLHLTNKGRRLRSALTRNYDACEPFELRRRLPSTLTTQSTRARPSQDPDFPFEVCGTRLASTSVRPSAAPRGAEREGARCQYVRGARSDSPCEPRVPKYRVTSQKPWGVTAPGLLLNRGGRRSSPLTVPSQPLPHRLPSLSSAPAFSSALLIAASFSASFLLRGSSSRIIPPRNRIAPSMIAGAAIR